MNVPAAGRQCVCPGEREKSPSPAPNAKKSSLRKRNKMQNVGIAFGNDLNFVAKRHLHFALYTLHFAFFYELEGVFYET